MAALGRPAGADDEDVAATAGTGATLHVSDSFAETGRGLRRLTPLEPSTLADLPEGVLDLGDTDASWTLSTDGSTLAEVGYEAGRPDAAAATVVIRDVVDGAERARFAVSLPGNAGTPRLSHDGRRLVLAATDWTGLEQSWYVFDNAGRPLGTSTGMGVAAAWCGGHDGCLDPAARRLYRLILSDATAARPQPTALVAHDLDAGRTIGRLELPYVLAQSSTRWIEQVPVHDVLQPGVALSPDGRRLAIAHADRAAVTLVDAERLVVERTIALREPANLLDRLAGLLPFAPVAAAAKAQNGTSLHAVFAPDGRRLYLFGSTAEVGADIFDAEAYEATGLGLRVVDLATRQVTEALREAWIDAVLPTPDGHRLYVASLSDAGASCLWRLDARSLAVQAERRFEDYRAFVFLPKVPGAER